jgi:hypothetical protein
VHQLEDILAKLSAGVSVRRCDGKSIVLTSTRIGWITAQDGGGANPFAAEPSNQHAGKPNAASSSQANIVASEETNRCWRNERWHLFFPHNRHFDQSKN